MTDLKTFSVPRQFKGGVERALEAFAVRAASVEGDDESTTKTSKSKEICAAILDRYATMQVKGYILPRLDQPSIKLANLLECGVMSEEDARVLIHAFSEHEAEIKKLVKALEIQKQINEQLKTQS